MPPSRADRRLLLVTGSFLAIALVLALGVIWVATARSGKVKGAFFIGLERPLVKQIRHTSPLYFANPTAGDGFWLDVERGKLVALAIDTPGRGHCVAKWKEQRDAYVDCHGDALQSTHLDRYELTVGPRHGSPEDSVYVDLHDVAPAPGVPASPS